jgi:hypothetical protein
VLHVLQRLWDSGHAAYVVGGGVRDWLLGRTESDWDVATDARPERMLGLFPAGRYENKFGTVTIGGETVNYVARDSALATVQRMPGVKDVVNDVKVLPTSIFDDQIRIRTARAIYRDSVLGRYATDPVDPIRIIVDNGHVTLYGTVQSQMDKNIAGLRANGVFGAFSVDNKIVVN